MRYGKRVGRGREIGFTAGTALIVALSFVLILEAPRESRTSDSSGWNNLDEGSGEIGDATPPSSPIAPAGEHHLALRFDDEYQGVSDPRLVEVSISTVGRDDEIFGVVVHGRPLAFAREAMSNPARHVVNLVVDRQPICVTYCNLVDTARVLAGQPDDQTIDLGVGGLDVNNQMVLSLDGIRYGQSSAGIPLDDFPFEITTLGEWSDRHPGTLVYQG